MFIRFLFKWDLFCIGMMSGEFGSSGWSFHVRDEAAGCGRDYRPTVNS
jgi:hypothetical protein